MKVLMPKDLVCGICSGIPPCCVRYYLKKYFEDGKRSGGLEDSRAAALFTKLYEDGPEGHRYVVCPECLKAETVIKIACCQDTPECFLRYGTVVSWFTEEYFNALHSFVEAYEEGTPRKKDYILAKVPWEWRQ